MENVFFEVITTQTQGNFLNNILEITFYAVFMHNNPK